MVFLARLFLARARECRGGCGANVNFYINLHLREQDEARLQYLSSLRNFWIGYYELRQLTLFDFVRGEKLVVE